MAAGPTKEVVTAPLTSLLESASTLPRSSAVMASKRPIKGAFEVEFRGRPEKRLMNSINFHLERSFHFYSQGENWVAVNPSLVIVFKSHSLSPSHKRGRAEMFFATLMQTSLMTLFPHKGDGWVTKIDGEDYS